MRIKLDIPINTKDIACFTGGKTEIDQEISYICTNSKEAHNGDLFVALSGERFNGEDFVTEAILKKAIPMTTVDHVDSIIVSNTREALLMLAGYYQSKLPKLRKTIAITGSVGKTTTKEFTEKILSTEYNVHKTFDNQNNEIGVSLTILSTPKDTEILLLEIGMNHKGELLRISKCIYIDLALITNIGTAHIGNLGSREEIAKAKLEVTEGRGKAILFAPFNELLLKSKRSISFSTEDKNADYCIVNNHKNKYILYEKDEKKIELKFELLNSYLIECLCAAISISRELNVNVEKIQSGISLISNENIRQSVIQAKNFYFLSDCYNASYESVKASIDYLYSLDMYTKKSVLLGDILELGSYSEDIHRRIAHLLFSKHINLVFLFGKQVRYIMDEAIELGMPSDKILINDSHDHLITARQILSKTSDGEIILVKGSRRMKMERIIELCNMA